MGNRFKNNPAFVVCDWGNRYLKQMELDQHVTMTTIENSVVFFNQSQWEQKRERYRYSKQRFTNTEMFAFRSRLNKDKWVYAAVGDASKQVGVPRILTEEIKYTYDTYWGAIVCAELLRSFPNGHENLVLALAHPTKSIGQRGEMINNTLGKHQVEKVDGTQVRFVVREVLPWDEPIGGVVRWSESLEAAYNKYDLSRNSMILVVDIGGGVTSFTRIVVDTATSGGLLFQPVYDAQLSPSFGIGVRQVMERLRSELAENHEVFAGMKNISDDMLEKGIKDGEIRIKGKPVDVRQQVAQAEYQLLDQIELVYQQSLDSGRAFEVIVTTGGGMHSYHDRLRQEVWDHPNIESAGPLLNIHFANLIGGNEMLRQWIERETKVG